MDHSTENRDGARGLLPAPSQIQHARVEGECRTRWEPVVPAGKQKAALVQRRRPGVTVQTTQGQRSRSALEQTLEAGQRSVDGPTLCCKSRNIRDQRAVFHRSTGEGDHPRGALAVAPQIQDAPTSHNRPRRRQPVAAAEQQQRSFKNRGPAHILVHPAQTQRPGTAFHQALRPGQYRTDAPRQPVEGGTSREERAVEHGAPIQTDGAQRTLRIASQVEHPAACGNIPCGGEAVAATAQRQRPVEDVGRSGVGVCSPQSQSSGAALDQTQRSAQHRGDASRSPVKRRTSRRKCSVAHRPPIQTDGTRQALGVPAQVQHPAACGNISRGGEAVAATTQQQSPIENSRLACVDVGPAQGQRPSAAFHQALRPTEHRDDATRAPVIRRTGCNKSSALNRSST